MRGRRSEAYPGPGRRTSSSRCANSQPRRPADALAECADEILARLAKAKAPVIVVDVEIRRYGIEKRVTALARKLKVPVVTTFMGRGLLEGSDVLLGTYFGPAGEPDVSKLHHAMREPKSLRVALGPNEARCGQGLQQAIQRRPAEPNAALNFQHAQRRLACRNRQLSRP